MSMLESTPRQNLARWAADRGHPALRFRPLPRGGEEEWIANGEQCWERFLATALDADIDLAVEAARRTDERR